jgi:hypothetical protein
MRWGRWDLKPYALRHVILSFFYVGKLLWFRWIYYPVFIGLYEYHIIFTLISHSYYVIWLNFIKIFIFIDN